MYTLLNGKKVQNLQFTQGNGPWEVSQWYWYEGKKAQQAYNTETGEIKIYDAMGNELYIMNKSDR